jgi:hypothetical protein
MILQRKAGARAAMQGRRSCSSEIRRFTLGDSATRRFGDSQGSEGANLTGPGQAGHSGAGAERAGCFTAVKQPIHSRLGIRTFCGSQTAVLRLQGGIYG